MGCIQLIKPVHFNPLRREGGDVPCLYPSESFLPISIHSAARAETQSDFSGRNCGTDFNPLRREGGDPMYSMDTCTVDISIHSAARAETLQECIAG